jgi:hypothetical protein
MIVSYPLSGAPLETPIPAPTNRRNRYDELILMVIIADGEPVAVTDLSLISGRTAHQKAVTVHSAARSRGIRVQTSFEHGYLYVGLVRPRSENAPVMPRAHFPRCTNVECVPCSDALPAAGKPEQYAADFFASPREE